MRPRPQAAQRRSGTGAPAAWLRAGPLGSADPAGGRGGRFHQEAGSFQKQEAKEFFRSHSRENVFEKITAI